MGAQDTTTLTPPVDAIALLMSLSSKARFMRAPHPCLATPAWTSPWVLRADTTTLTPPADAITFLLSASRARFMRAPHLLGHPGVDPAVGAQGGHHHLGTLPADAIALLLLSSQARFRRAPHLLGHPGVDPPWVLRADTTTSTPPAARSPPCYCVESEVPEGPALSATPAWTPPWVQGRHHLDTARRRDRLLVVGVLVARAMRALHPLSATPAWTPPWVLRADTTTLTFADAITFLLSASRARYQGPAPWPPRRGPHRGCAG